MREVQVRQFHYRALNARGQISIGWMRALDVADLEARLRANGGELLSCRKAAWSWRRRLSRRNAIGFCFHLEQGLQAGLPLLECLQDLRDDPEEPRLAVFASALVDSIEGGSSLSEALAEASSGLDEVLIGLVRAGEHSGRLPEILKNLGAYLRQQDEFVARMWHLLAYPLLLFVVIIAVLCFLLIWLVPELSEFLHGLGRELPWYTLVLLGLSRWFVDFWYLVLAGFSAVPILLSVAYRHPRLRYSLDAWLLRLPALGPLLKKLILARVATALHVMYGAGMNLLECLQLGAQSAGNRVVASALHAAGEHVRAGSGLAESFRATNVFPSLVLRMIRVGENTGALEKSLAQVCYFYERDVREAAEQFQTLLEPALTVFFGCLLAWIVIAMMGPVYDLVLSLPL